MIAILLIGTTEKANVLHTIFFLWIRVQLSVGRSAAHYRWQKGRIWGYSRRRNHQRELSKVPFLKLAGLGLSSLEAKNEVNQTEPLKVIFEKVWRIYEVPDTGKGQMQSLSFKREKRRISEIKDQSAFPEKNTEETIKSFVRKKKQTQNKNNPRNCETTKICQKQITWVSTNLFLWKNRASLAELASIVYFDLCKHNMAASKVNWEKLSVIKLP